MSRTKSDSKSESKTKKLPDMTDWTDEEITQFWETHSAADYWDELEPVEVEILRPEREVVALRLDKPILEQIKAIAAAKSLGYTTLLRIWIKEKLIEATVMDRMKSIVADALKQISEGGAKLPSVEEIDARVEPYSELVVVTVRFASRGEPLRYKLHPSQLAFDEDLPIRVESDLRKALKERKANLAKG